MLILIRVAVTGGLASGKSSACLFFRELGAYVISADEVVHQLLSPHTSLGKKIIQLLGNDIVVHDQIDRTQIARKVFGDPKLLRELENLLHPAVQEEIEKRFLEEQTKGISPLFIVEIPLLYEIGAERFFDKVIAVVADEKLCRERYKKTEYDQRLARQLPSSEKARRADYIIENNGSLEDMKKAVFRIFKILTEEIPGNGSR